MYRRVWSRTVPSVSVTAVRDTSLDFIDGTDGDRLNTLVELSAVNSGSTNLAGLADTLEAVLGIFEPLGGVASTEPLEPYPVIDDAGGLRERRTGQLGRIRKRPDAPLQVLLVGHYDTVFAADHSFQRPTLEGAILRGPGVADMKGGLLVMAAALEALERSEWAGYLGWEVLLNPDEELGSPASAPLLGAAAAGKDFGLVFEPTFPDGHFAGRRKGSGTFTIVVRGTAAHAGRDHHLGRNAIAALARIIAEIDGLNGRWDGVTINVGVVSGGAATNIVPDLAIARLNVRVPDADAADAVVAEMKRIVDAAPSDMQAEFHGGFTRWPKAVSARTHALLELAVDCGRSIGLELGWRDTGGVSDGNNLAAAGLANVDNLGVHGGNLHQDQEFMYTASLTERSKLAALMLIRLASGDAELPT